LKKITIILSKYKFYVKVFFENNSNGGNFMWIYTKTIRLRNGRVLIAENYGLTAFKIYIDKSKIR